MDVQELSHKIAGLAGCDATVKDLLTQKLTDTSIVHKTAIEEFTATVLDSKEHPSAEKLTSLSVTLQLILERPDTWIEDESKDCPLIDELFDYLHMYQFQANDDMTVGAFLSLDLLPSSSSSS
jgi:hypothetical protein